MTHQVATPSLARQSVKFWRSVPKGLTPKMAEPLWTLITESAHEGECFIAGVATAQLSPKSELVEAKWLCPILSDARMSIATPLF